MAIIDLLQKDGVPFLVPLLQDKNPIVRWAITGMLYDWGNSSLLPFFEKIAVTDSVPNVRIHAISGIGKYGDSSYIPLLEIIEQMDEEETILGHTAGYTARVAIEQIMEREDPTFVPTTYGR